MSMRPLSLMLAASLFATAVEARAGLRDRR